MVEPTPPKEEDVYNLQVGLDDTTLTHEAKHFFDVTGYRVLRDLLTDAQRREAVEQITMCAQSPPPSIQTRSCAGTRELSNIIELGGAVEHAMALDSVIDHLAAFVWGHQFRLVGSKAILVDAETRPKLSPGPADTHRRYAAYRCAGDGQFRCLMITFLIPTSEATLLVIPSSHKANLPLPCDGADLTAIPALEEIPVPQGSALLCSESLARAIKPPASGTAVWLAYQYGTSYMVNWPGCDPSPELLARTSSDPAKAHLLLEPYYHPPGSYRRQDDGR